MAFVIFYHKHFYCISVKYNVCMHVSVLRPDVATSMAKEKKKRTKKKEKKLEKKSGS